MNATDDDGLMTQHTIGMVIRMSQNIPLHVKVCPDRCLLILWRIKS
jgi:transformation/transcription domain-associated protein